MNKVKAFTIIGVILALFVLVIGVFGAINNCDFWNVNVTQVITVWVAIFIAFMASQAKSDERKSKERMEKLFDTINQLVSDPSFYCISPEANAEETNKRIMMVNRRINNCISILKESADNAGISEEMKYIQNEFTQYDELVSEHIADVQYLSKSENELRKHANNIASKCDRAVLALYK